MVAASLLLSIVISLVLVNWKWSNGNLIHFEIVLIRVWKRTRFKWSDGFKTTTIGLIVAINILIHICTLNKWKATFYSVLNETNWGSQTFARPRIVCDFCKIRKVSACKANMKRNYIPVLSPLIWNLVHLQLRLNCVEANLRQKMSANWDERRKSIPNICWTNMWEPFQRPSETTWSGESRQMAANDDALDIPKLVLRGLQKFPRDQEPHKIKTEGAI